MRTKNLILSVLLCLFAPAFSQADENQRDIADQMSSYTWGSSASGTSASSILTGLKNLGYTNATYGSYNFTTAYNNIKARRPVLLGGSSSGVAHIWIADGYWEQTWKCTRKVLGITVKTWYEYVDMFYMNWGWNGTGNAWVDQASWSNYNSNRVMWYNLYPVY